MGFELNLTKITDQIVRDNFSRLLDFFRTDPYLKGEFSLVTGKIVGNNTSIKFAHNLKFTPKDAILTSAIWSNAIGVLTLRTDLFDAQNIAITVSGIGSGDNVEFKALVGRIDS